MLVIAENLNASDPVMHAAIAAGERRWFEDRARTLAARGCDAIDVNAGTFGSSEAEVLEWLAEIVEAAVTLPLSIDSSRPDVIARVAQGRRVAPILNSLDVDTVLASALPGALARSDTRLIVQLRRGRRLPTGCAERMEWTELAVEHLHEQGVAPQRLMIDAVMLPWGSRAEAGAELVEFVEVARRIWPELVTLVGLSNVSYGHARAPELHASWLDRLQRAGLGAVLLDVLDPVCMAIARRTSPDPRN